LCLRGVFFSRTRTQWDVSPAIKRKITLLARAGKCGFFGAIGF